MGSSILFTSRLHRQPTPFHPPSGFDRPDLPPSTVLRTPEVYNIPLRSLYSRKVSNLMMAGRDISASRVAALCVRRGLTPRQLCQQKDRLRGARRSQGRQHHHRPGARHPRQTDLPLGWPDGDGGNVDRAGLGAAQAIRAIQIAFDTGFRRELSLTASDRARIFEVRCYGRRAARIIIGRWEGSARFGWPTHRNEIPA